MMVYPQENNYKENLNNLCMRCFNQSACKSIVKNFSYPEKTSEKCMCKGPDALYKYLYKGIFTSRRSQQEEYEKFFGMPFDVFRDIVTYGFSDDEQTVQERIQLFYLTHN